MEIPHKECDVESHDKHSMYCVLGKGIIQQWIYDDTVTNRTLKDIIRTLLTAVGKTIYPNYMRNFASENRK